MRMMFVVFGTLAIAAVAMGCGGDDETNPPGGDDVTQVPPPGPASAVKEWIDAGHYKSWNCEAAAHDPIAISPHGKNRICTNAKVSGHTSGEYPVDSAGVKELYDAAGANVVGYAVYRHVKAGTTGDTWYWYEIVPQDSMAPHDANGIVADGLGDSGPPKDICVSCHGAAGIDAMHPGHDFVYTQVP
jgi:hypothetical protein